MTNITRILIASVLFVLPFGMAAAQDTAAAASTSSDVVRLDPIADAVADANIQPVKGGYYVQWPALATISGIKLPSSQTGKFEIVFDVAPNALEFKPTPAKEPEILQVLAEYWIARGKPEHAIVLFRRGLETDPKNLMFQNNMAMLLSRVEGDNRQALDVINKALTDQSDNVTLLDSKGLILMNDGRSAEAIPVLERAVELSCQHPIYCLHLAKALNDAGRGEHARNWFDKMRPLLEAAPGKLVKENKDMFDELRIRFAN